MLCDALTCLACKFALRFTNEIELTVCCLSHCALQAELEDEILQLLSSATGNLLDNVQLINTLNASKTTWEQVNQSLQVCSYLVMLMPCLHCSQLALTTLCSSMHSARLCLSHHSSLRSQSLAVYACHCCPEYLSRHTCSCVHPLKLSLL